MENKIVLKYKDVVLRDSDMDVLNGPCYLNDEVIRFYFSNLSSSCAEDGIAFVPPSVSCWLTNCDVDSRKDVLEPLNLANKRLILFPVNNNDDFGGAESGTHWSTLVYDRSKNSFFHLDTMQGVNNEHAVKLYESVKEFIDKAPVPILSSSKRGKHKKKNGTKMNDINDVAYNADVVFKECDIVQQTNGYDCGVYVMAIAKTDSEFNHSGKSVKVADWFSFVDKHVDSSIEMNFRNEVIQLIQVLRNN